MNILYALIIGCCIFLAGMFIGSSYIKFKATAKEREGNPKKHGETTAEWGLTNIMKVTLGEHLRAGDVIWLKLDFNGLRVTPPKILNLETTVIRNDSSFGYTNWRTGLPE